VPELVYVPASEFERARTLDLPTAQRTRIFADLCRINTLYMIARAGSGHIGSSFSSLDIVCHLFLNELQIEDETEPTTARDVYFSSKGHDAPGYYAVLIGLGLLDFDLLHRLRRLDGLPGHPDVSVPHVEVNSGSLGMGISKAKGIALAKRLLGSRARIFVMTGDGELQEGQVWESLGSASNLALSEITVIVDHNKLQSDTFVSQVCDLGDLESKFQAFGWHVKRCDGHDTDSLASALSWVKTIDDRPSVILADTVKGKGVSFMEHTRVRPGELYAFHSGAPSTEQYQKAVQEIIERTHQQLEKAAQSPLSVLHAPRTEAPPAPRQHRLIHAYSKALVAQGRRVPELAALDADLILDCGLIPFRDAFPERFFECGIAEQDMVSQASGMALGGLLPVVHSFACFLSARANEQIYNAATERKKILYVGTLAGLLPGGPGHSHQSVRDISALAAVPGLILIEPATEEEVGLALAFAVNDTPQSVYLRLTSLPWEVPFELPTGQSLELGRGVSITDGSDAVLFTYGPIPLSEAYQASRKLAEEHGIGLKVINLPWLNRVDPDWLGETVRGYSDVFTLDNHYVTGGQGDVIAREIGRCGLLASTRLCCIGVDRIPECGSNREVLRAHGLDSSSLVKRIAGHICSE
jgi:transketolase